VKRFSLIALCICYLIIFSFLAYYPKFEKEGTEATISYDVAGYYLYLPAIFIYRDVHHLAFQQQLNEKYRFSDAAYQGVLLPDSTFTMKYPIGASVMYAPFFLTAHAYSTATGKIADGFAPPYQRMLSFGCLFYAFAGLWFLRKILLHYFSEIVSGITLILIVAATNYLNYSAIDNALTHNLLFTLFTLIIYLTITFYKSPTNKTAILIGLLCGLTVITRPTDIIICVIPLLWGVYNIETLTARFNFIIKNYFKAFYTILSALLVGCIQLLYWKYTTGSWVFYSYEEQSFDWLNPYLKEGLFSYRKGWFIYTPLMILIIPGFIALFLKNKPVFIAVFLFTIINIYVVFSWSIWWYGGSLGQRSMVESYALLSFPIAACIAYIIKSNWLVKIPMAIFALFTIWYNCILTIQAHSPQGILDGEHTNKSYFLQTFGKLTIDTDVKRFLDTDEVYMGKAINKKEIYFNDIEYDLLHIDTNSMLYGKKCLFVTQQIQGTQPYAVPLPPPEATWLRVSGDFLTIEKVWDVWKMPQFTLQFKYDNQIIKSKFVRVHRMLNQGEKKHIVFDVKIPTQDFNAINIFMWNADGNSTTFMDNLRVEILE
jgi:hypothetical protein